MRLNTNKQIDVARKKPRNAATRQTIDIRTLTPKMGFRCIATTISSFVIPFNGLPDIHHFIPMELVMGNLDPEQQLIAAQKAGFETIFSLFTKAFEGTEKLVELNVQAVKSTLAEHQEILAKAFSVKELHELFALHASQTQPTIEKAQSYGRHVCEIISGTQGGFAAAAEAQLQQHYRETQEFVDKLAKNAPAGSETAVAAWKAFIKTASETASTTYEAAKKATKQAEKIAESNASAASSASAKRTRQAVEPVETVQK